MLTKFKPTSEFSQNVLKLMTGTIVSQAIPIAISPMLTRIYTPEDFGIFALYLSIASIVSVLATARYEMAIVLPHSDIDAMNIVGLSIVITFLMTCLSLLMVILFKSEILGLFKADVLGDLLYLIPLSLFLTGLYQVFNYWANRKKRFEVISQSRILQSSVTGVCQIGSGYFNYIGGLIIGNILGLFISIFRLIKNFDMELLKNINKEVMIFNMKKYKDFPLINSLHVFSDVAKTSLASMVIALFYGPIVLGFYSLSMRILQAPLGVIGPSFGQVLFQRLSVNRASNEPIYDIVRSIVLKLFLFALPVFIILYFTLPLLFIVVFGENWRLAGEYSQILLPYLFMNFLISPISQVPLILNKQKEYFYISLVGNLLFIAILIYFKDSDIVVTLNVLSTLMSIYYLCMAGWYYYILRIDNI